MLKYKGYYIEKDSANGFHSKADIDAFLKQKAVDSFKQAIRYFSNHASIEASAHADEIAERLHKAHGFTWEEIEQIEINALTEQETTA